MLRAAVSQIKNKTTSLETLFQFSGNIVQNIFALIIQFVILNFILKNISFEAKHCHESFYNFYRSFFETHWHKSDLK